MPCLRNTPYRARACSVSGGRCARFPIAGAPTSRVTKPQAFGRGNSGRAFDRAGSDATQATHGATAAKRQRAAEICRLCHRFGGAGWGRLPLRSLPAEQAAELLEFQTIPGSPRLHQRWVWPPGRSQRRNGYLGHLGRQLLIPATPGCYPTACRQPNTCRPGRQPRRNVHDQRLPGTVPTAQENRPCQRWAAIGQLFRKTRASIRRGLFYFGCSAPFWPAVLKVTETGSSGTPSSLRKAS